MVTADPALRSPLLDTPDEESGLDALTLGRRIRNLRTARRMTLDTLAAAIDRAPSQVSMIENGKREPRLSMLRTIAAALGTSVDDLLQATPPSPRAALEIAVERAQRGPVFTALGLPQIRVSKGQSDETLQTLLSLHNEIERLNRERAATPEEARRANATLRGTMRARDNYFPELEAQALELLAAVGHTGGPVSHQVVADMASHLGYSLHYVSDLPHSTRSVTDKRHGRI
ncbi:MAG TPA: helix-turn-helix transcriptional regulator, partial [Cryobacterium sp.]|nr:helix-turn-helix transcriptional regulator [Cryobacterium sp.]